jgi:hypothetical protein
LSANIINIKDFRKVIAKSYIAKGDKQWDVYLTINSVPFLLVNFKINNIKREVFEISYDKILHNNNEDATENCIFCGQGMEILNCPKINQEINTLFFEKIMPAINKDLNLSEMILSNIDEAKGIDMYIDNSIPVQIKTAGISTEGIMLFTMIYKNEYIVVKEYMGEIAQYTIPVVMYENEKNGELYVHMEFIMPENMFNLLSAIEKYLKENKIIYDITGVSEKGFLELAKEMEDKNE